MAGALLTLGLDASRFFRSGDQSAEQIDVIIVVLALKDLRRARTRLGDHFQRVLARFSATRACLAGARIALNRHIDVA